jgi:hypothetical protein
MELLLNLIWAWLAVLALFGFLRGRSVSGQVARVPYRKSLIAVACVLVLLFPVVSASDDLHPTQAVVEEASKRVQRAVAPLHWSQTSPPVSMLPVMLALYLIFALTILRPWRSSASLKFALDGVIVSSAGRAPPISRWN